MCWSTIATVTWFKMRNIRGKRKRRKQESFPYIPTFLPSHYASNMRNSLSTKCLFFQKHIQTIANCHKTFSKIINNNKYGTTSKKQSSLRHISQPRTDRIDFTRLIIHLNEQKIFLVSLRCPGKDWTCTSMTWMLELKALWIHCCQIWDRHIDMTSHCSTLLQEIREETLVCSVIQIQSTRHITLPA